MRSWIAVSARADHRGPGAVPLQGPRPRLPVEHGRGTRDMAGRSGRRGERQRRAAPSSTSPCRCTSGYQRLLTEEVKSEQMRFSHQRGRRRLGAGVGAALDGSSSLTYEVTIDATRLQPHDSAHRRGDRKYPASAEAAAGRVTRRAASVMPRSWRCRASWCSTSRTRPALAQQVYEFVSREIGRAAQHPRRWMRRR